MTAFLSDELVSLRPVRRTDLETLADWRNEPELRTRTREWAPLTEEDQKRWFENVVCAPTSLRTNFMFVVEGPSGNAVGFAEEDQASTKPTPIGCVGLCYWDQRDRVCEVSFYMGDENVRGKGYATRALRLLIGWGFSELGLDRIWAEAFDWNEASIKLLTKLGFKEEGRLRKHVWRNGERHDSVMLGLLRGELV